MKHLDNLNKKHLARIRPSRKNGKGASARSVSFTSEEIAYLDAQEEGTTAVVRRALDAWIMADKGGTVNFASQLKILEIQVQKEEKERDHVLHASDTWNAWEMKNEQYVLDADRNLIPKPTHEWKPCVQAALESYKVHNKKVAELQKKIAEIKAKILSNEEALKT